MPKEFITLCVVLLMSIGAVFILVGWFMFSFLRLNPESAIRATGNLVCFRQHLSTLHFSNNYIDYHENGPGRVPVVVMKLGKESFEISAAAADYSLTESDIGKAIRVRYQQKFGIVLLTDNERTMRNYIQLKKTLFWCFFAVGMILITIGVILLLQY